MKGANGPVFFTICSKNLLGYAKTCLESVRQHHPDSDLYIFLADRFLGPKEGLEENGINVVTLEEHGGLSYRDMIFRYNITEFNTSIKPFCFLHLFEKYERDSAVIYLDPDTWLQSPLVEVVDAFDDGANAVLIPHMTEPLGFGNLPDRTLLRYGAYNFGFVALKNTPHNEEIVCWWADELRDHCVIDYENGLFVDQKYGDLFPSFIPDTAILRHNGYNVAYWNLISRTFTENDTGELFVNGEPLRFVHFSGASLKNDTNLISRHCTTLLKKHRALYGKLLDSWSERLEANQHSEHLTYGYSFFWNNMDKENEHTPEEKRSNDQAIYFERNQWLFMLQFTELSTYDSWMERERLDIEKVGKAADDNPGLFMFCNSCFSWSAASEWDKDKCGCCGANGSDRLLNAFLYQELKLKKDSMVGLAGENGFMRSGLSSKYKDYSVELTDNTTDKVPEKLNTLVDYVVISSNEADVTTTIENCMEQSEWPNIIACVEDIAADDVKSTLDDLMNKLNQNNQVRVSLFFGLSANHAQDGCSSALLYIENLRVSQSSIGRGLSKVSSSKSVSKKNQQTTQFDTRNTKVS